MIVITAEMAPTYSRCVRLRIRPSNNVQLVQAAAIITNFGQARTQEQRQTDDWPPPSKATPSSRP